MGQNEVQEVKNNKNSYLERLQKATAMRVEAESAVEATRKLLEEAELKLKGALEEESKIKEEEETSKTILEERIGSISAAKEAIEKAKADIKSKEAYAASMANIYRGEE